VSITAQRFTTQARTWLMIAALSVLLILIGRAFFGAGGVVLFAGIAIALNLAGYWFSDRIALRASNAQPLAEDEDPGLHAMVRDLARRAGVPVPRLYLIPSEQPNAFATGRNPQNAALAVTVGLRRSLPEREVRGVLAHEFAHIRNRDILVQSIASMIGASITMIANVLQLSWLFGGDDEDSPLGAVGAIAAAILAPIAALLLQMAVSRQREYLADATGAELLRDPAPLADALVTLERGREAVPMAVNPAMSGLYGVNPLSGQGLASLFSTHPPTDERIRRLWALQIG
jgi:heat shock protein HtpX